MSKCGCGNPKCDKVVTLGDLYREATNRGGKRMSNDTAGLDTTNLGAASLGTVQEVLKQRGNTYGPFINNATYAQVLKHTIRQAPRYNDLAADQREALDNIMQKIARAVTGSAEYLDNWVDMVGYAQLIVDRMQKDKTDGKA